MRIFYAFIVIVVAAILWLLPVTEGIYDFKTDLREDNFTVTTGLGETTANVTLLKAIYDDDTSTITISSDDSEDVPLYSSYNATTRSLSVIGFSDNNTRSLTVTYDIDAITGDGIDTLLDQLPWIWILIKIALPAAAIAAIFMGKP